MTQEEARQLIEVLFKYGQHEDACMCDVCVRAEEWLVAQVPPVEDAQ